MKKLLLITTLFLSFSCMKNDNENQLQSFAAFGEIIRYDITTLELKTDYFQKINFNITTALSEAAVGNRLFVVGGMKNETEGKYEAELYQVGYVGIKSIVKKEDVDESQLGTDGMTVSDIVASGKYLNFFIPTKNHCVTLVVNEAIENNGILKVEGMLYNETDEMLNEESIISFDISEYLSFNQIDIKVKYKNLNGLIVDENITIHNN